MKKRLAIITSHPIQYNAPFFKLLSQSKTVQPKVFYTWGETVLQSKHDPGFDKTIEWDIPLLEGYEYEFLDNVARDKGSHHYKGIINPRIITRISEWKPDAILVYGWKFQSHLKVIRHFHKKIPVWFRGDSTLLDEKKNLQSNLKKRLLKWVYGHIDLAFYTGTRNKEYFLRYGLKPHQLIKAFHAIDNERFQNINERYSLPAAAWKAKLKIDPVTLVFLFAGKLEPKKGAETLLNAFKAISNNQVHLLVVGNGPLESDLKRKYEAESNVTFTDFQNQMLMPVVYCLCDVFVLPSTGPGESWGLAVNEAMAAGKPVIVSDKCGGAIDLVKNKVNGFIFKAGNPGDLAVKMQTAIDHKNELAVWGKNSLALVSEFSFGSFVSVIEKTISIG
jgi:glycosyltransferase involved in cell wall biosynthesis